MKAISSVLTLTIGGGLVTLGLLQALNAVGADPNTRLVYGWSFIAILGLYLTGLGVMSYLSSGDTKLGSSESISQRTVLGTRPSARSNTSRRRKKR